MLVRDEFQKGKNNIGYVSSSFEGEFGSEELPWLSASLKFQVLPRLMSDSEILSELKIQECTLADVLFSLKNATAEMKDGSWNIFYIKGHSHVVRVYWRGGEWVVYDWHRDDYWSAGARVFSPATPSSSNIGAMSSETLNLDPKKDVCECERCGKCGRLVPEK